MRPIALGFPAPEPTTRIGVEHELRLWAGTEQVDFRKLIGRLAGAIRPLDPGDPRVRRLPSGVALTADGLEAELASPPVDLVGLAPQLVDDVLRSERRTLLEHASAYGITHVTGFSTHLNISVPDDQVVPLARAFVTHCLTAVASVVEPAGSQGMLVRPRRGRLEVGGEYVEGPDLVAGLTLLAACVRGLREGTVPAAGPAPSVEPSREKFGWFVPPGELDAATDPLDRVWSWARPWAEAEGLDTSPVDVLGSGERALRRASREDPGHCSFDSVDLEEDAPDTGPRDLAGGVRAETEWLTWQHAVWLFRDSDDHTCRAVVPAVQEPAFLAALDSGGLDRHLTRMLRPGLLRRSLLVHAQVRGAALWHDVRPGALVPAERLPDGSVPKVSRRRARRSHRRTEQLS